MSFELLTTDGVRAMRNPSAAPASEPYGPVRSEILNDAGFNAAQREICQWPGYAPTPLRELPALAERLGVASVHYKDEGDRFGLKSFKALGGAYAVYRLLAQAIARRNGGEPVRAADVVAGRWREVVKDITVTCATDGNHGRSVAWGAQLFGCRCVIYIHATVSEGRGAAIAKYGAEVIRVRGNYDDSVRHADAQAKANGWTVVSDTTYEGYRAIPIDVMHGYGVMSREIVEQIGATPPTHVIVQAGVGALAASVAAAFWLAWGDKRPKLVIVEPTEADCYLQSAQAGKPVAVTGALDTVMAGLACGEVSPAAWEIVSAAADGYLAIDDHYALDGVRLFANPQRGDPAIVSGETGATGLGALLAAREHRELAELLGIDAQSRVLLLGSEGDTDPEIYRQITGRSAEAVRS
ncbi:diaminopropionate ammonia-lyase [Piscinibacter sakaiensis]|uniref:diaminopropionate ammonia-lyase n=1 Tax=Piscinibacter sakaiensis TaxID=1547922 RepID=UPI003AAFBA3B